MMKTPIPTWLLERLALGELPPEQQEALRRRLEEEPEEAAKLAALQRSNREILTDHDPAQMADAIRRRAGAAPPALANAIGRETDAALAKNVPGPSGIAPWRARLRWSLAVAAPAAAAILLVVMVVPGGSPEPEPAAETTRLKGQRPYLMVHRQGPEEPERLGDGAVVRPHDLLQLSYVGAGRGFGIILSLDGAGAVTLHLPATGQVAAKLEGQGAVPLQQAYELDDAPGYERFILVTSSEPFPVETALHAALSLAADPSTADHRPLPLPRELEQASLLVKKNR